MKPQPPTLTLKRGKPVLYFENEKPQSLYLSGKIGSYRLLSNSALQLDSGTCVHTDKFPFAVFPAANEHGVIDPAVCARIAFSLDRRLKVTVSYVQTGPSAWCAAVSEMVVGDGGRYSPITAHSTHSTLEGALAVILPALLLELRELATNTDEQFQQRSHSLPKSLYSKARRFGRQAIYTIISSIPRPLASDILKSLNGVK